MNTTHCKIDIVPAIDLLGGGVVRLYQGDFDQVTEYVQDPLELAQTYLASGARRLHVVDLDGARTGDPVNLPIIEAMAALGFEIQAGGGIRDQLRLETLLAAGVSRAVVGSVAVEQPAEVAPWIEALGADRFIIAVDVRLDDNGTPEVLTRGWQQGSGKLLWPVVDDFRALGVTEFLCTDIARDGTLQGPNIELYRQCAERYPEAEFIASGGVSSIADIHALNATGVTRVVTGKALLDGRLTLQEIEQFSRDA